MPVRAHEEGGTAPTTGAPPVVGTLTAASLRSGAASPGAAATVTVVICCYDLERYQETVRAVRSVVEQDHPARVVVVVDHSETLAQRLRAAPRQEIPPGVEIVTNAFGRGASGARNTAALVADTDLVAFLDDDAYAEQGWLSALVLALADPGVVGAGGQIRPLWSGPPPRWFPPVFGWVVGATFEDVDRGAVRVRNVWSGNMLVRRSALQDAGGFLPDWGKVGDAHEPEDTEFCIRLTACSGGGQWLFVPAAVAHHAVPQQRSSARYFLRRCVAEGRGKARLRHTVERRGEALSAEAAYLRSRLPRAASADVVAATRGDLAGLARAGAAVAGVAAAGWGFASESAHVAWARTATRRAAAISWVRRP